ncbi:MAG: branched-chain amino acid ABC transporter substrate-binding protein [Chloroflexota bacterium]
MKRILYPASSAVLLLSTLLAANAFAAGSHSPAHKHMIALKLCSSTPFGVPPDKQLSQGIRNGEHLAMYKMRGKLRSVGVKLMPANDMDDAQADGSTYSTDKEANNARICVADNHAIGYIGTLNSGAAEVSEPITNQGYMVQVSPANTSPALTSFGKYQGSGGRQAQEPATFHHHIPWVTYYRTVTTDALQGPAGALYAKQHLHVKSVYVIDDKLQYGVGLASAFQAEASRLGIKVLGHGHVDSSSSAAEAQTSQAIAQQISQKRPGMVYCGCDAETIVPLPVAIRRAGFHGPFMGGDALENSLYITDEKTASINNYASSVGPDVAKTSKGFRKLYKTVIPHFFGNPGPQSYDAPSYDASMIVLTAVYNAAKHHQLKGSIRNMRRTVVHGVRYIHFSGATGKTSFDNNGDTTNRIISIYKVQGKNWVFRTQVAPKGFKPAP